jgi:hypothetical protein
VAAGPSNSRKHGSHMCFRLRLSYSSSYIRLSDRSSGLTSTASRQQSLFRFRTRFTTASLVQRAFVIWEEGHEPIGKINNSSSQLFSWQPIKTIKTMKSFIFASALLGSALASVHHEHGHMGFHHRRNPLTTGTPANATCGCTTYTTWFYGEPTRKFI